MPVSRAAMWILMIAPASGCEPGGPVVSAPPRARPARPAGAVLVPAGTDLQARIDAAGASSVLALEAGLYRGPVSVAKPLTIWGPPGAILRSTGTGSTLDVVSAGVSLLGFTVDGSGGRFDLTDAAVRVRADDVHVVGLQIEHALFGILVEKARAVEIRGNVVHGNGEPSLGLRGDGIRLWEVRDSVVIGNHVLDSRDLVVWYSSKNRLIGNTVERSRYGTHFMYSHHNVIADNHYLGNVVSVFLMYSRGVVLRDNVMAFSTGAAGLGLGLKESDNIRVIGNRFVRNGVGVHSDNSPLDRDSRNQFEDNLFRSCDAAVVFNGIAARTSFRGNVFRDNLEQVRVDGGDDAQDVAWDGNDFDDYRGYDLDGDGTGDVPYELRSFSSTLIGRYPNLAFLRGTPALATLDVAGQVMPLFQPKTILVDASPSMKGLPAKVHRAR